MSAVCPCGRTFAKPFGMRVHQRTCPVERARSAAYVANIEAGSTARDHAAEDAAVASAKTELARCRDCHQPIPAAEHVCPAPGRQDALEAAAALLAAWRDRHSTVRPAS